MKTNLTVPTHTTGALETFDIQLPAIRVYPANSDGFFSADIIGGTTHFSRSRAGAIAYAVRELADQYALRAQKQER